jgi:hypothetical protein
MGRSRASRKSWLLYVLVAAVCSISLVGWVVAQDQQAAATTGTLPPPERPAAEATSTLGTLPPPDRPAGTTGAATQSNPSTQTIPGVEGAFRNAPDVAELLIKSANATGIEIQ